MSVLLNNFAYITRLTLIVQATSFWDTRLSTSKKRLVNIQMIVYPNLSKTKNKKI